MKEDKRGKNPNSLRNLRPIDNSDEAVNEAKSKGKINASINRNLLASLRTELNKKNLIKKVVAGVLQEVKNGKYVNAIKLLDIAKEKESQEINLNGGAELQKVFVDEKTKKEADKHIDSFIND